MEQKLQESAETCAQAFVETHEPVMVASGRGVANPRRTRLVTLSSAGDRGPSRTSD